MMMQVTIDTPSTTRAFDVDRVRADFPILQRTVYGKPLVYLDNAATAQKPQAVIDALTRSLLEENANIHRGVHWLSQRATEQYEAARGTVQHFLNAAEAREIIFVRGTTEAINLVAHSYARPRLGPGDEILISTLEHHSNIVPWQLLCEERGARLRIVPMTDEGELILEEYERLLSDRTKMVAVLHVSNALGTIVPVKRMVDLAHAAGAVVLVDGAQAAPHLQVDVQAIGCDFYAMSSHKLFGPTGIGALYGRAALLEAMPPYQGGGDMISAVSFEKSTYNVIPHKFEAGTPNIAGVMGFAAAIDYVRALDWAGLQAHEHDLVTQATEALATVPGLRVVGTAREKTGVVSFVMNDAHPHDVGTILDQEGVAIRTGHHCCMPLMDRLGVPATARASFAFYNTHADIEALLQGLHRVREVFA